MVLKRTCRTIGRKRETLAVSLFFVALSIAMTWPAILSPASRLAAPAADGDPFLNLWILGWDLQTLASDPAALFTGRVFQAGIFHPADLTLAYSDHLLPQAVALLPLYAVTGNLVVCYNVLLLLSLAASGVAMYVFARTVTGSRAAAVVAGTAWAFAPYHFAHLLHLQLQGLWTLPLTFLFLHRVAAGRRLRDAFALGLLAALQAATSAYYGVIGGVGLGVGAIVLAWTTGQIRRRRFWSRLVVSAVVAAAASAPFVWPYWVVQQREGHTRNIYEASHHAAVPASYLHAPPGNLLYGRTGLLRPSEGEVAAAGPERELFTGFTLMILATAGAWWSRRRPGRHVAATFAAVAAAGFLLSLGPAGSGPVYSALHRFVFGFQAIRAPARFGVLVLFGLAILAAAGTARLEQRLRARGVHSWVMSSALVAAVLLESVNVPIPTVPAPPFETEATRWLAENGEPGAVIYLPLDLDAGNTPYMIESLRHGRPIVNGYSGQRPSFFVPLVEQMSEFPSPSSLWMLRDLGVRFVVSLLDPDAADVSQRVSGNGPTPLVERARFETRVIYEVVWTEDVERGMPRPTGPAPPPPGPAPFLAGERAVYEVGWKGAAGMGLGAGEAEFAADEAPQDAGGGTPARHLFTLSARTAPWVSRFFEADDRFETVADASMLPIIHRQIIREGRRRLDRLTTFDAGSGTVQTDDGPRFPLAPGSRDALSAFYYARTIALEPGGEALIPISEGGRQLAVRITAAGVEKVSFRGADVEALRLDVRIEERIARRRPIEATLWMSRDERRIPLVIEVAAGFGDFRAELVSHEAR